MAKLKAAVIFGGTSREHELSLASAADVIRKIPEDKYEVICIGITKKGRWLYFPGDAEEIRSGAWELNPDCTSAIISPDPLHRGIITIENGETSVKKIDVAFPLLQGKRGADGSVQGLLDLAGIPYVGCGLLGAASCMDKSHTHMVLDDYGVKTADWKLITQREMSRIEEKCEEISSEMGFPLVVKPANSGSNAGTSVAENMNSFIAAVKIAFSNDNKVVVEKYIKGRKLEAAVFGYDTPFSSYIGEIVSEDNSYDPTDFSVSTGDDLIVPADLPNDVQNSIRETAVTAYKALGCKGLARVDFFLTEDGELLLNKIGTSPGLRKNSVFTKLMNHLGMDHGYLLDKLLEQAIENAERSY
ncbi:MAG: D-alanine--D-alanine ligase [Ruminococcus flavefaciens]|nr:D-alanine--D-alanine ligase [Ruminococcus flavefaciens]MCM1061208.1 D-alanine--D-alanine ligase [Eubacterium sp.]MCM1435670.1 D-alanine--D-alanine ligase [Ruminococcus flavefaciens]